MRNHMNSASRLQSTPSRMSTLGNAWTSLHALVTGKTSAIRSTPEIASSPTTTLFCDKWRPAGIALFLKDRSQWADLGCQNQS